MKPDEEKEHEKKPLVKDAKKKAYVSPQLVVHGDVERLTASGSSLLT